MFTITITIKEVTEGDVTDVAQAIWDAHAEDLDAKLGDFELRIARDGFAIDWQPTD
jgi:hypothetical protein